MEIINITKNLKKLGLGLLVEVLPNSSKFRLQSGNLYYLHDGYKTKWVEVTLPEGNFEIVGKLSNMTLSERFEFGLDLEYVKEKKIKTSRYVLLKDKV